MDINITLPRSWGELTQPQLRTLLDAMADVQQALADVPMASHDDYAAQSFGLTATRCLFAWAGFKPLATAGGGTLVECGGRTYVLTADGIAGALDSLGWMRRPPERPVRLDTAGGVVARVPLLLDHSFSFDSWLACENLWQAYALAPGPGPLRRMAEVLYGSDGIQLTPGESLGVFYWWLSVKEYYAALFPHFFTAAGADPSGPASPDAMRRSVDSQLRALTKGDITKEQQVLALPAMRALTELDALAREYDELNRKYPQK